MCGVSYTKIKASIEKRKQTDGLIGCILNWTHSWLQQNNVLKSLFYYCKSTTVKVSVCTSLDLQPLVHSAPPQFAANHVLNFVWFSLCAPDLTPYLLGLALHTLDSLLSSATIDQSIMEMLFYNISVLSPAF